MTQTYFRVRTKHGHHKARQGTLEEVVEAHNAYLKKFPALDRWFAVDRIDTTPVFDSGR